MLSSDLNARQLLNNVKYVTRLAKLRKMNIFTSLGTTAQVYLPSTTVRHLTSKETKALKTTKFIESRPIYNVKKGNIPPF